MRQRGVSIDHARRVASRWTLGTGRELRSYPVAIYGDIFGPEDGWAVCKEIKVLVYKEQKVKDASERWLPCRFRAATKSPLFWPSDSG